MKEKSENTGRFYIYDENTGRKFVVEPIDNSQHAADSGDMNPATKKIEGHYVE